MAGRDARAPGGRAGVKSVLTYKSGRSSYRRGRPSGLFSLLIGVRGARGVRARVSRRPKQRREEMRRIICAAAFALLLAGAGPPASAQEDGVPKAEVFGGYSWGGGDFHGWGGAGAGDGHPW